MTHGKDESSSPLWQVWVDTASLVFNKDLGFRLRIQFPWNYMGIPIFSIYFLGNGSIAFTRFLMEFVQPRPLPRSHNHLQDSSPEMTVMWLAQSHIQGQWYCHKAAGKPSWRRDLGPPKDTQRSVLWCWLLSMRTGVILVNLRQDVYLKSSERKLTSWSPILKEKKNPLLSFCPWSEGYYAITEKTFKNETGWKRGKSCTYLCRIQPS